MDEKVKDSKVQFFEEKDFEETSQVKEEVEKPIFYKDLLQKQALKIVKNPDKTLKEEESYSNQVMPESFNEEQRRIKEEFLTEVQKGDDEEGLLQKKEKTKTEIAEEEKDFEQFMKQQKQISVPIDDMDLIRKFWGDDTNLSKEDKFLRYYLLSQAWKKDHGKVSKKQLNIEELDQEDLDRDSEMDRYESHYNMRFEEGSGEFIPTHDRKVGDSLRAKKKSKHDRERERKLNKKQEKAQKLKQLNEQKAQEAKEEPQESLAAEVNEINVKTEEQHEDDIEDEPKEVPEDEPEEMEEWWFCDKCQKPIKAGDIRYDCTMCENYTLCKKCFKIANHPHKLRKEKASVVCKPPKDYLDLIRRVTLACSKCGKGLEHIKGYECSSCQIYFCKECKEDHTHAIKKLGSRTAKEETKAGTKNQSKEEHFEADYNDLIDSEIPVKFEYRKAPQVNYGLTDEELLLATEKELTALEVIAKREKFTSNPKELLKKKQRILKAIKERTDKAEIEMKEKTEEFKKKRNRPERIYIEKPTEIEGTTIKASRLATYDL